MKKFLIYLFVFSALFLAFDRLFLFFIYNSPAMEVDKRLELVLNGKINKDIIILGSSSGARDFIATKLERDTKKTVYNLSYPGADIEFKEFLLRALLKYNSKPKIIILTLDSPNEVLPDSLINFRLDRLDPLVKYDYIDKELISRNKRNAILSKLFVMGRMSRSNIDIRQKKFTALDTIFTGGSMTLSFQKENADWNKKINNTTYPLQKESRVKLQCLLKIITSCKQHNIKLLLVSAPVFTGTNPMFIKRMRTIAGNDALFYEFDSTDLRYKSKNYYYDVNHLKINGAIIFTDEIAAYLKKNKVLNNP